MTQRTFTPLFRLTAVAALAIGTSMSSHAGGGEALDIEMPSMRTPIEASSPTMADAQGTQAPATTPNTSELPSARDNTDTRANAPVERAMTTSAASPVASTTVSSTMAPYAAAPRALPAEQALLSRADVKEALKMARATNTITPSGEIGDTTEVLQAREDFYLLQTEVIQAEYAAAAEREMQARMAQQALDEEQRAREQQATLPQSMEPQSVDTPDVISQADTPTDSVIVESNMTIGELVSFLDETGSEGAVVVVTEEQEAD